MKDTGHSTSHKLYMEDVFSRALFEASEAHRALEGEKATRDAEARPVMVRYCSWHETVILVSGKVGMHELQCAWEDDKQLRTEL